MDTIEQVGALVGIAAFLALAVLAVLFFIQAREVTRLRDWAGRAPERAASIASREGSGEDSERASAVRAISGPTRLDGVRERLSGVGGRSPIDPLYLGAIVVGLVVAAGVVTSGFGVLGGEEDQPASEGRADGDEGGGATGANAKPPDRTDVTVLNGTRIPGVSGVPGAASEFSNQVLGLGYRSAESADAPQGIDITTVMFRDGSREEAQLLRKLLRRVYSGFEIQVDRMDPDIIRQFDVPLALVVGRNYEELQGTAEPPLAPAPDPAVPPTTPVAPTAEVP